MEFGQDQKDSQVFGRMTQEVAPPSKRTVFERVMAISAATGASFEDVGTAIEDSPEGVTADAKKASTVDPTHIVQEAVEQESDPEVMRERVSETMAKNEDFVNASEYFVETALTNPDGSVTQSGQRLLYNMAFAEKVIADKINEVNEDTSTLGMFTDFVDRFILRALPIGMVEDLTFRTTREGEAFIGNAATMGPEEFEEFFTQFVEERASEGVFKSENIFAYQELAEAVETRGINPTDNLDFAFGVFDLLGLGKVAKAALKGGTVVKKVAAVSGSSEAAEVGSRIAKVGGDVDPDATADLTVKSLDTDPTNTRPLTNKSFTFSEEIVEENPLVQSLKATEDTGFLGRVAREDEKAPLIKKTREDYEKALNRGVDVDILKDNFGLLQVAIKVGRKSDGAPFKRRRDAEKLAERDPRAEVVEQETVTGKPEFFVQIKHNIDISGVADDIEIGGLERDAVRQLYADYVGAKALSDSDRLTTLSNLGEAGVNVIAKEGQRYIDDIEALSFDSFKTLNKVLQDIRDGVSHSGVRRQFFDRDEFISKWKTFHPKGAAPTEKDFDAYYSAKTISDANWILKASGLLRGAIAKNFWSLEVPGIDGRLMGKRVDEVPEGAEVFYKGSVVDPSTVPEKVSIWKLDANLENEVRYVADPETVKALDYEDVLGYNPAGLRDNHNARYFAVVGDDKPRAFVGTFTEKQAIKATEEVNEIFDAAVRLGPDPDALRNSDEFNEVVRKNNTWNTDITDADSFLAFAKAQKWDFTKKASYKERNGEVTPTEATDKDLYHGTSWGDYVATNASRSNDVIIEFGGARASQEDPIASVVKNFNSESFRLAYNAYSQRSIVSWVKKAMVKGSGVEFPKNVDVKDYRRLFEGAKVTGTRKSARELARIKSIIQRRMSYQTEIDESFSRAGAMVAEFVFDKSGGRIKAGPVSPITALLKFGFESSFGFFAFSQAIVQSAHILSLAAISPKFATKAVTMAMNLRFALNAPDAASEALAVQRMAKYHGISEADAQELATYIKRSGRGMIEGDAMELGTATSYGVAGWLGRKMPVGGAAVSGTQKAAGKFLHKGKAPFRFGERMARLTAITTAFLETKAKYPKLSALSDEGIAAITQREQALTFNMTTGNRAAFQEGIMRLPSQFLSYSFRSFEAVAIGKDLSKAERSRLAASMLLFYGAGGTGFFAASGPYLAEMMGAEPGGDAHKLIQRGVVDYLINEGLGTFTDTRVALSGRIAPLTAFYDLYNNIYDGKFAEVALGPSGSIGSNLTHNFHRAMGNLLNGRDTLLTENVINALRTPSGIDAISKAYAVYNYGTYKSKTGTPLGFELKTSDAVALLLGIAPEEVHEVFEAGGRIYWTKNQIRTFTKEINNHVDTVFSDRFVLGSDEQTRMLDQISDKISLSGLPEKDKQRLRRGILRGREDKVLRMILELYEQDKPFEAEALERSVRDGDS